MKKSYVLIQDFKAPYVIATGMAHKPSKIMLKRFTKGEIINGELKNANGRPSFVLVNGVIPVPVNMLHEVITKEIVSDASGQKKISANPNASNPKVVTVKKDNTRYLDAGIVGAILGFGLVYLAEKKGWIKVEEKKNKMYGAIGGAVLAMYIIYRKK
tara:strand:+ start:454 stop:924 length:471 start_codon:yes stop_codon:yes gene_type:complete